MSTIDVMPLSTSAYIADTAHLSLPHHGAYMLILMTMWRANGWIADDDRVLASICKTSVLKWRALAIIIRPLLLSKDGKLSQKRLLIELKRSLGFRAAARKNGSKGGAAKALKSKLVDVAKASALPAASQETAAALPDQPSFILSSLTSSTSESRDSEKEERKKERPTKKSTSLPEGWTPSEALVAYGLKLGLQKSAVDDCAENLRLWAKGNAHRTITKKADWDATFHGWMRREASKLNGGPNGQNRNFGGAAGRQGAKRGLSTVAAGFIRQAGGNGF